MPRKGRKKILTRCLRETCERLAKNDPTLSVFMTDKEIGSQGIKALGSTLKTNTNLKWIYLEGTNLSSNGRVELLVEALRENTSVENLYLYSNCIGDEGARTLAGLLREGGPPLKVLALYGNKICCNGAKALIKELEAEECKLERLDMRDNTIGTEGALAFSSLLRKSTGLKSLFLEGNGFSKASKLNLVQSVKQNYFLQHFGMDYEESGCELATQVKFYLRLNRTGRRLLRSDNCPPALWGNVLEKLEPDLIHYYLKSNPRLFMEQTKQGETTRRGPTRLARKRICYRESALCNKRSKMTDSKSCIVQEDPQDASKEMLRLTLERSTSMSWGVWLCNRGGMCLVSRALDSMPGNTKLQAGDAILVAKAKPFATDIEHDGKDNYKNVVRLFRTSYTIHVMIKRARRRHLTIRRRERDSWGVWLEGNAGICIVAGARNTKRQKLCCGDLIWSAMDESGVTQVVVPSGKDWYQRMIELFQENTVLHLVIGSLGPHVEAQPKVVLL